MGLFKRLAANHRARVADRQDRKAHRRANRQERKINRMDARNERQESRLTHRAMRQQDRLRHKDGRLHARLEKRGTTIQEQDERDLNNAFPMDTVQDNYSGGFDSGSGSFVENTYQTPISYYDNEPNYIPGDYDVSSFVSLGEEYDDPYDGDYPENGYEDSYY